MDRSTLQSRNTQVSSVLRLPSEILGDIFLFIVEDQWATYSESRQDWNWIRVSHVCRSWREVAMEHRSLWSYIVTSVSYAGPSQAYDAVKAFLQRSGTSQLRVQHELLRRHTHFTQANISQLELALHYLHRIKELTITGDVAKLVASKEISSLLKIPAPHLKRLELLSYAHTYSFVHLSNAFFADADLESLSLRGVSMDLRYISLNNLAELSLMDIGFEDYRPNLSDLCTVLRKCIRLVRLTIDYAGPTDSITGFEESIVLPHLRFLSLRDIDSIVCGKLVGSLVVSPDIEWDLKCDDYPILEPIELLSPITNSLHETMTVHIAPRLGAKRMTLNVNPGYPRDHHQGSKSNMTLLLDWTTPFATPHDVIHAFTVLVGSCSWKNATSVVLDLRKIGDASTNNCQVSWSEFLPAVMSMQVLDIILPARSHRPNDAWSISLFRTLTSTMSLGSTENNDSHCCPKLSELRLTYVDCTTYGGDNFLRDLRDCLKFRSDNSMALQRVKLKRVIGVHHNQVASLLPHELFSCVEWDQVW